MYAWTFFYTFGAAGKAGVENMLDIFKKEMRVAMTLTSNRHIQDITSQACLNVLPWQVSNLV